MYCDEGIIGLPFIEISIITFYLVFLLLQFRERRMLEERSLNTQCVAIKINGKSITKLNINDEASGLENINIKTIPPNKQSRHVQIKLPNQKKNQPARMKLRDYLFLAETSASKNFAEKRKMLQCKSSRRKKDMQNDQTGMKEVHSNAQTSKYGINNSEMFKILKDQIYQQIQERIEEMTSFKHDLTQKTRDSANPSNEQMVTMFSIRSILKQKIKDCLKDMKSILHSYPTSSQSISIQLEEEERLRTFSDFTFERLSTKLFSFQQKESQG